MPTYKNNTNSKIYYNEGLNWVNPGQTIEIYKQIIGTGLTKTSEEPFYNPVILVSKPTGSGDFTLIVNSDTKNIEFYNVSSYAMRAYLNLKTNTPAREIPSGAVININNIKDKVSTIICEFDGTITSGQVVITEFKK